MCYTGGGRRAPRRPWPGSSRVRKGHGDPPTVPLVLAVCSASSCRRRPTACQGLCPALSGRAHQCFEMSTPPSRGRRSHPPSALWQRFFLDTELYSFLAYPGKLGACTQLAWVGLAAHMGMRGALSPLSCQLVVEAAAVLRVHPMRKAMGGCRIPRDGIGSYGIRALVGCGEGKGAVRCVHVLSHLRRPIGAMRSCRRVT